MLRCVIICLTVSACSPPARPASSDSSSPPSAVQPPSTLFVDASVGVTSAKIDSPTARGVIRGRVTVSGTRKPKANVEVVAAGECTSDLAIPARSETDANGEYRIDLKSGSCGISVTYKFAQVVRESIAIREGQTVIEDVELDHAAVFARSKDFSRKCPTSGNTARDDIGASRTDVAEIARAVLVRFSTYPNYLSGWDPARTDIAVAMNVDNPSVRLGDDVLPTAAKYRFRWVSAEEARAEKTRPKRQTKDSATEILSLSSVHSDGTCALVATTLRYSLDEDLYEKRNGSWQFVRRVSGMFWN